MATKKKAVTEKKVTLKSGETRTVKVVGNRISVARENKAEIKPYYFNGYDKMIAVGEV